MQSFNLSGNPSNLRVGKLNNNYKSRFYYSRESTEKVLTDSINRLKAEVGSYIEFLKDYNKRNPSNQIGFFSLPRLLFPEIESLEEIVFPLEPGKLFKTLGIEYPSLAYQLFRNSLMHQSNPSSVMVGYTKVDWAIGLENQPHSLKTMEELGLTVANPSNRRIDLYYRYYIDMFKLYESLVGLDINKLIQTENLRKRTNVPFLVKIPRQSKGKANRRHSGLIKEINAIKREL